jgi:hypothetical protein
MSSNVTGANLPEMMVGTIHLKDVGDPLEAHGKKVHGTFERYPNLGGNGQIGKAFNDTYYPAAKASAKFLNGLGTLLDLHGEKTVNLTNLFGDMNDTATTVAGSEPDVGGSHHVV